MQIMNLTKQDLVPLAKLFRQFWNESSSPEKMAALFKRLSRDADYLLLAAKVDGSLAGFCMGIVCQSLYGDGSPFLLIEDFVVAKACRRRGIGTALLSAVEARARRRGCTQVILVTESGREDARRFYAARGFSPTAHKGFKKRLDG